VKSNILDEKFIPRVRPVIADMNNVWDIEIQKSQSRELKLGLVVVTTNMSA
jgi:hypothetical protein